VYSIELHAWRSAELTTFATFVYQRSGERLLHETKENLWPTLRINAENVSGKFYVDDQCIDCDLCRETAPANFTRSDDGGYSYVSKQPTTPEEEALCKEAMEGCPVEAIGNNGEG
jgi:ferredoxin